MRKFLSLFLAGCLFLLLPVTTWAFEETTYESEQGQAMIKAPSSSVFGSGDSTDSVLILIIQKTPEIPLLPELTGLQPTLPPVLLPITPDLPYASIRDIRAAGLI